MDNLIKLKEEFINKKLEEDAEECSSFFQWKDFQASPLGSVVPAEVVKNNFKSFFKNIIFDKRDQDRIAKGVEILDSNLYRLPNEQLCRKELQECSIRIARNLLAAVEKFEKDPASLDGLEWMQGKETKHFQNIAELLGLSFEICGSFYEIGAALFREKQFEEACSVFQFVSLLQPYTYEVWLALGMSHQRLEELVNAVSCFSVASLMDPSRMEPYIYSAECLIEGNEIEDAKGTLLLAKQFLTDENRYRYDPLIDQLLKNL